MIRQGIICLFVGVALSVPSTTIDSKLSSLLATEGKANIAVSFKGDTNEVLARANKARFATRGAKATFIKAELEQLQLSSQNNALRLLSETSLTFKSSWIANRIFVKNATPEAVAALAALPEVTQVREEIVGSIVNLGEAHGSSNATEAEWGVEKIEAPAVWNSGVNGTGVVVAVIDSGVRGTHERLRGSKRSSYDWFDPIYDSQTPRDVHSHGTHCAGSIAGSDGIGVAPGAEWIACVGCNAIGNCPESAIVGCGEWASCPSLPDGSSPNCDLLADVVSHSWAMYSDDAYDPVIAAYRANGIIPVFAGGNNYWCGSIIYPGSHKDVISVGSTNTADELANSSSRGPTRDNRVQPDISAPGVDIVSASHVDDTSLRLMSGTSMATPHVAGVVALLLSKNPNLSYTQITEILYSTAERDLPTVDTCGNTPPNVWPNNMYGHGRANALKAVNVALSL